MNRIFLIADSGSTKTDWCVVEKGQPTRLISTKGMNPFFQTPEEMETEIRENLFTKLPSGEFAAVYFYGAGCTPPPVWGMQRGGWLVRDTGFEPVTSSV